MLTQEELQIVEFGKENGKSPAEAAKAVASFRASQIKPKEEEPGVLSSIGTSLKDSFMKGKEQVQGTGEYSDSIAPVRGVQLAGTAAMAIPKAFMAGISSATPEPIKEGLNKYVAQPISTGFKTVTDTISDSKALQNFVMEHPTATKVIEETAKVGGGLSETASGLLATQGIAKTALGGVNLAKASAVKTADIARQGVNLAKTGTEKATGFIKGARDIVKPLLQKVKTLPGKARTNVEQIRATEATIKSLPQTGQNAVRSGVGLADVKALYQIPKNIVSSLKPLVKSVREFASGKGKANPFKTNPLEIVGKPMTQGLKTAQAKANTIGQKLGRVADSLPKVTTQQVFQKVVDNLKKVRGLEGLKVTPKGQLVFKDTVLATAGTNADRIAIQKIFTDAIKAGSGKSKHLLRQELFEILGGKKRGGLQITGTQEKAFEAVRKGLADTLDDMNSNYKSLNMQYAKTISPIQRLQKMLNASGVDEDLLSMKAGLLARRLTSFAKSNPEIRQILRDLDKVIATKGKTLVRTEQLQDFYNILDKYYDVAGRTGFQGQVTAGVSKALEGGGFPKAVNFVEGQVGRVLGETDIVKQKALDAMLKEILGD